MSNQQSGAWQTAGRSRTSHSASRTPQSRSGTGSPSQQTPPPSQTSAGPRQDSGRPQQQTNNVWNTQRSSSAGGSNGQAKTDDEVYQPVNGFNAAEVKAFLARDVGVSSYKPADVANAAGARSSGGAWGSKPGHMANNQPFLTQLAKQIATLEGGG